MANTIIQIKSSSANDVPATLNAAELGYSFLSNKLFIGNATGQLVVAIGGKYFVDQQNTILTIANLAFDKANAAAIPSDAYGWTNTVFGYSNTYTQAVGAASNTWANTVGTSANSYAAAVGVAANAYSDSTFLKLTGGTLNGSLNVSGNLVITGNTTFINVATFRVNDPLIYLAGNNYTSDIVDIGFVGNYNVGASQAHTGVFRDAGNKEWYVFEGYNAEPDGNNIDPAGNNFTISVLNATLRTSNIILNGANAWAWINSAYAQANAAPSIANSYAAIVGAAANGWANTVGTSANSYAAAVGVAAKSWANSVGTAANSYAATVGAAANTNAANATYLSTGTVPSARISGNYTGITGIGTVTVGTWNANTITVPYGGTGVTSFTTNGVLYGNNSGSIKVTAAGTDGQVLVSNAGVPTFQMLNGGSF